MIVRAQLATIAHRRDVASIIDFEAFRRDRSSSAAFIPHHPSASAAAGVQPIADTIVGDLDSLPKNRIELIRSISEKIGLLLSIDVFEDGNGFVLMFAKDGTEHTSDSFLLDFDSDGKLFGIS